MKIIACRILACTALSAFFSSIALGADYQSTVAADGPLAYYRLNDPTTRSNTNKNIGSLGAAGNATNINVHPVAGAIVGSRNPAGYFDSTARSIIPWNAAINPDASTSFTVEAWFYPTSDKVAGAFPGPAPIMNRYSGSVANRQGWVYFQRNPDSTTVNGQSQIGWNFRTYRGAGSSTGIDITSQVPYRLGQWQHVVTVWDGPAQTATMYIDGVQAATQTSAGSYVANTDDHGTESVNGPAGFSMGSYNNTELGSNPFRGGIDEVAFYSKKLTAAQIQAHYQNATNAARSTPYETLIQSDAPVAYIRFDDPAPNPDMVVNMGLLQASGAATNTAEVRHSNAGAIAGSTDGAFSYHWRNGGATTVMPFIADNNPDASVPFTVEGWFRPTSDRINPGAAVVNNRYVKSGNRTGWVIFQRAPNDTYTGQSGYEGVGWNFRFYTGSGSGGRDVVSNVPYKVGDWQHVVTTWDGANTATMYINGVAAATNSAVTYAANTDPTEDGTPASDLAIGSYNIASGLGSNPYEGDVDEFAIYKVQLTPDQILAHYQAGTNSLRTTNYSTLVLTAPQDGTGAQALQPVTYLRLSDTARSPVANKGTLSDAANGSVVMGANVVAGPRPSGYPGLESSNNAVSLDGTKNWISLDHPAGLNISGIVTLEAWIKPDAVQGDSRIVSHGPPTLTSSPSVATNGSVLAGNEVALTILGGAAYAIGTSDGTNLIGASAAIPTGDLGGTNWIHLAGTYDGAKWILYRNGVQIGSTTTTIGALPVTNGDWAIGSAGTGWTNNFAGAVDEVAIYNKALSASQVLAHFNAAKTVPSAGSLTITRSGNNVTIGWTSGTLEQADEVTGPWSTVTGANPPSFTVQITATRKFYRFKN